LTKKKIESPRKKRADVPHERERQLEKCTLKNGPEGLSPPPRKDVRSGEEGGNILQPFCTKNERKKGRLAFFPNSGSATEVKPFEGASRNTAVPFTKRRRGSSTESRGKRNVDSMLKGGKKGISTPKDSRQKKKNGFSIKREASAWERTPRVIEEAHLGQDKCWGGESRFARRVSPPTKAKKGKKSSTREKEAERMSLSRTGRANGYLSTTKKEILVEREGAFSP